MKWKKEMERVKEKKEASKKLGSERERRCVAVKEIGVESPLRLSQSDRS